MTDSGFYNAIIYDDKGIKEFPPIIKWERQGKTVICSFDYIVDESSDCYDHYKELMSV